MHIAHGLGLSHVRRHPQPPAAALEPAAIQDQPLILGHLVIGSELTAQAAPTSGQPSPTLHWTWQRNGVDVAGETGAVYTAGPADVGQSLTVVQHATNALGTDSASSNPVVIAEVGPVISNTSFDDVTDVASFTATETGTLHWALYLHSDGTPNLNGNGTWLGTTQETGTGSITSGSSALHFDLTTTTGNRLTYGVINASGGMSNLITHDITLAAPASVSPVYLDTYNQPTNIGSTGSETLAGAFPDADTFVVLVSDIAGASINLALSGSNVSSATKLVEGDSGSVGAPIGASIFLVTTDAASDLTLTNNGEGISFDRQVFVYRATGATAVNYLEAVTGGTQANTLRDVTLPNVPTGAATLFLAANRSGSPTGIVFGDDGAGGEDADMQQASSAHRVAVGHIGADGSLTISATFTGAGSSYDWVVAAVALGVA